MAVSTKVNDILLQAQKLDREEQLTLLEQLVQLVKMKQDNADQPVRLSMLRGLGSEVWSNTEIDTYLNEERQW